MSFLFRFHDLIDGIHIPIDDGVDKLNRKYTLIVLLFLALPIFTKQYIGEPIECFTPTYFTESQARYVNSYCWTASTYFLLADDSDSDGDPSQNPLDSRLLPEEVDYAGLEEIPVGSDKLRRVRVSYYQWAPLILLVQGVCFHLPFMLWGACAHNAGVKLRRLLKRASDISDLPPGCPQREALLTEFVDQFHTLVTGNASCCADPSCRVPLICRCTGGPSRYLCVLYLLIKALYVFNVLFQFILLTAFMGRGFIRHGLEILRKLLSEGEWWTSPRFPLQTLCQVRAAIQGGLRTYICRCVLPINVFNEKIFSVVWFYLVFLLPFNVISVLLWMWRTFPCNRLAFVRLILWRTRLVSMADISRVSKKISSAYLGWDGVFVLRMIEHNHGSQMATIIIGRLWEYYANQMKSTDDCPGGGEVELGNVPSSTMGPSTSWHTCHPGSCNCPISQYGHSSSTLQNKRINPNGYWGKCS